MSASPAMRRNRKVHAEEGSPDGIALFSLIGSFLRSCWELRHRLPLRKAKGISAAAMTPIIFDFTSQFVDFVTEQINLKKPKKISSSSACRSFLLLLYFTNRRTIVCKFSVFRLNDDRVFINRMNNTM